MMEGIEIIEVKEESIEILTTLQNLLPQLTSSFKSFEMSDLKEIVDSKIVKLYIAIDRLSTDQIVGTYTLVMFRIPTGNNIRIEDVIVDDNKRGRGIGKKMIQHAIDKAKSAGVKKIELTTHQWRVEANNLYQSLGFTKTETNVYRYTI